uniref:Uncharacterized protein n=1 Tax=Arundo donax TaxID=35708 RepID=A0A0A8XVF0_ARUDO
MWGGAIFDSAANIFKTLLFICRQIFSLQNLSNLCPFDLL